MPRRPNQAQRATLLRVRFQHLIDRRTGAARGVQGDFVRTAAAHGVGFDASAAVAFLLNYRSQAAAIGARLITEAEPVHVPHLFDLEVAEGRSIALKPKKPHGAPATINLEALLTVKAADRVKWLKDQADQALTGQGQSSAAVDDDLRASWARSDTRIAASRF